MKRPVLVTIIGVLAIISGVVQMVIGGLLLGVRNDATLLADNDLTTGQVTGIAVACLVVGALVVVFAVGLLKGNRLSRVLIGAAELAQIAAAVYVLVQFDSSHRSAAIGNIVGSVVVLYFLFGTQKAKDFFAR